MYGRKLFNCLSLLACYYDSSFSKIVDVLLQSDILVLQTTLLVPTYQGVIIHTELAVDEDLNSVLQYQIISGNTDRKFAIDSEKGAVYVQDPQSLRPSYNLGVKVRMRYFDLIMRNVVGIKNEKWRWN